MNELAQERSVYACPVHLYLRPGPGKCHHYDYAFATALSQKLFKHPGAHIPQAWCGKTLVEATLVMGRRGVEA